VQRKSILLTTQRPSWTGRAPVRLLVLDHGKKMTEGTPRQLITDNLEPDVVRCIAWARGAKPTRR
jgi:lipooligosaccharide transport system ATP-binding protein